jgi:hypothetical protein
MNIFSITFIQLSTKILLMTNRPIEKIRLKPMDTAPTCVPSCNLKQHQYDFTLCKNMNGKANISDMLVLWIDRL